MNNSFLQLNNIQQSYGDHIVVDTLSLELAKGTIGCLLGPSGCGKTTVLRCIAGFEKMHSGEIVLDGVLLNSTQKFVPPEQRHIGMVFQDYALFPHLNVTDNVGFGLYRLNKTERKQRIDELLDTMHLSQVTHKYPHELSGGQQQRVALARALAPKPNLLLLDEPFSNLDVSLRERLSMEVRDTLKQQRITAILVTHDQAEAFAVADEIGVMHQGAIQQWGTAENLYHHPSNRFVADFIGQGTLLPGMMLDFLHVKTELGVLPAQLIVSKTDRDHTAANCEVDILLRPSDIEFDEKSPIQATIITKAFRGAEILYTVRLDSGATVLLLAASEFTHSVGNHVGIQVRFDRGKTFAAFRR